MQHPEYLYHYTSFHHLPKILEAGFLKLTPSNLVEPKRYWRRDDEGGGYSMKKKQYRLFTSHGEHYGSWYVCEEPIPLSDVEKVVDNRTGEVIWERKAGGE